MTQGLTLNVSSDEHHAVWVVAYDGIALASGQALTAALAMDAAKIEAHKVIDSLEVTPPRTAEIIKLHQLAGGR